MSETEYNRAEAAQRAKAQTTNVPGTCQLVTRTWIGAPSAGDQDHDGDADAVDGWLSEPPGARHPGDRRPPRGLPVAWSGGRNGFGHRAISLGKGADGKWKIRTTDGAGSGRCATRDLEWVEENWGLHYLGYSTTMTGLTVPRAAGDEPDPKPKPGPLTRGARVDLSIRKLQRAAREAKGARRFFLLRSVAVLKKINPWHSRRKTARHAKDTGQK